MALSSQTRLGIYEILAPLGAGGMGEVYRARDTKLGRDVAIKVLPEEFAADKERLVRFEREAKVLASLNHPNIATIHGLEESDGIKALVLELVEGPTLAELIERGRIPLDEALAIARQVAEALEAGHEAGVIHRDLKPANIKLKEDGTVKVLDYGLAKALQNEAATGPDPDLSQSPTLTRQGTQVGVVLGTAAYMSPEQAKGKQLDRRTDIFAFGSVLYEMLTGRPAFRGDGVSDVLAAVIKDEPDWSALPPDTPGSVRKLLRRCLAKAPMKRLRHIGDALLDLEVLDEEARTIEPSTVSRTTGLVLVAGLLIGALASGLLAWMLASPDARGPIRLSISTTPEAPFGRGGNPPGIAISPDATRIVYASGRRRLLSRSLDQFEVATVAEAGTNPFFAPDGDWIGFFADGALKRVAVHGGPAKTVCPVDGFPRGASWGPDGTIVFASRGSAGLKRVSAEGGEPETLTIVDRENGEVNHRWPEILPGGNAILFEIDRRGGIETSSIAVLALETGTVTELISGGSFPRYATSGHVVYAFSNTLWAVGFDPQSHALTSAPVPVLEGVDMTSANAANFGLARDGTLVYLPRLPGSAGRTLVWVDRTGQEEPIGSESRPYESIALSPDGTRVATSLESQDANVDVWIYDLVRQASTRLTFDADADGWPIWMPDGERVVFDSEGWLGWRNADGTGTLELPRVEGTPWSALPDNETVLAVRYGPATGSDIYAISPTGSRPLLVEPFDQGGPAASPDGHWIAYQSNESGRYEVYVRPFPDVESGKVQISTTGGIHPLWAPSGRELFYLSDEEMMAVSVEAEPRFRPGRPTSLFENRYVVTVRRSFDIDPSGERFLMIREHIPADSPVELRVVLNWHEELKRLVLADP